MRSRRIASLTAVLSCVALVGSASAAAKTSACASRSDATISYNGTEPENPLVPGNTTESGGVKIIGALFTGLVRYDSRTAASHNAVAESIKTTDSRVYTIRLQKGWTFHDGTPVTAKSFADAWNYTAYGPNAQGAASFFQEIQGFDQVNGPHPTAHEMSGLRVIDDRTLKVTLTKPSSVFPTKLGGIAFSPLPKAFFDDRAAFEAHPIGNGPFRFVSHERGRNIVVERYAGYGGPCTPGIKDVEFRFYKSLEAAYAAVVANKLDYVEMTPDIALEGNKFESDLPGRHLSQTYLGIQGIAFPLYDKRFRDRRLRQAISMAIDRKAVIQRAFNGTKEPADGYVPPNVPGRAKGQCGQLCTYQPERARKLFAATGFKGPIELASNDDSANRVWTEAACATITKALGRKCRYVPVPTMAEYRTKVNDHQINSIFRSGWIADYPSIENFLTPRISTGGSANSGLYSNPAADRLLRRAEATRSTKETYAVFQKAERLVLRDMPLVPLWFQTVQPGWSKRLHNVVVTQFRELDLFQVTVS
jgi:oligopeptide transport system substrate-binding protein